MMTSHKKSATVAGRRTSASLSPLISRRAAQMLAVGALIAAGLHPAQAQVAYTLTSGNFSTISPPITGDTSAANGDSLTVGGTTYTSNDDLAFNLNFNVLTFTNSSIVNITASSAKLITLASTSGGVTPVVNLNGAGLPTLFGNITLALANNTLFTGTHSLTISGAVSGAGNLTDSTTGTLTLSGNNSSLTGNTLVTAGTLSLSGTQDAGSGTISVTGGTLQLGNGTTNGGNALTATNAVTLASGTTLNINQVSGTVSYAAFPITMNGNSTLNVGNKNSFIANVASPITLNNTGGANAATIGETGAADTLNLQGVISGTGDLKIAPGGNGNPFKVTINKAETYSGNTFLTQIAGPGDFPYLQLLAGGSLPSTTVLTLSAATTARNTTFDLNGQNQTIAGLVSAGASQGNDAVLNSNAAASALTLNDTVASAFGGVIGTGTIAVPTNANLSLTKSGVGTQTLSGTNTYIGGTTVSAGTLSLIGTSDAGTNGISVTGGTLQLGNGTTNGSGALIVGNAVTLAAGTQLQIDQTNTPLTYAAFPITMNGNSTLNFTGSNLYTATLTSPITLNNTGGSNAATISEGDTSNTVNLQGVISGTGDLKIAPGGTGANPFTVTLNQPETFVGNTSVVTAGGDKAILKLLTGGSLASTTGLTLNASAAAYTATFDLDGQSQTLAGLASAGTAASDLVINSASATAASALTINNATAFTYGGSIGSTTASTSNISLTKSGTGTQILSGTNYYTGATTVSAGTLQENSGTSLSGSGITVASGATLAINTGTATLNNVPITITGTGASGQRGALSFTTAGAEVYTLPNAITLNGNATIGQFGVNDTVNFNGAIGGTGSLTVNPEGGSSASHTATFNFGTANTYSGGTTTFASGAGQLSDTYNLNAANALPSGTNLVLNPSNGTLFVNLAGNNETLSSLSGNATTSKQIVEGTGGTTATLTINNGSADFFSGKLGNGAGNSNFALSKTGAGTLVLGGTNTYTGGTTITGGPIQMNGASSTLGATTNSLTINTGGALDLNGTNQTVDALGGTATGTAVYNSVSSNTSTLTVGSNNGSGSFGGSIINHTGAGTGLVALTKTGTGTQTLTGANTYSGGTTISNGTLAGTTTSLQGNIADNSALVFDQTLPTTPIASGTYAGVISGTGTVTKNNTGTLIFTGTNSYNGATTVTGGTLQVGNGTSGSIAGTTAVNVGGGTTLAVNNNGALNNTATAVTLGDVNGNATLQNALNGTATPDGLGNTITNNVQQAGTLSLGMGTSDILDFAGNTGTFDFTGADTSLSMGQALTIQGFGLAANETAGAAGAEVGSYQLLFDTMLTPTQLADISFLNSDSTQFGAIEQQITTGANANKYQVLEESPAPEPAQTAALGLFGLGLGALILKARKRQSGSSSASAA